MTDATSSIDTIRLNYRSSLAELTFNSKPIINSLTLKAHESIQHCSLIQRVIEDRLRSVAPEGKLPLVFLIDSILKNVGGAYIQAFATSMFATFTQAYVAVNDRDRYNMERVLQTWPSIFKPDLVQALNRFVQEQHLRRQNVKTETQQRPLSGPAPAYYSATPPIRAPPQPIQHLPEAFRLLQLLQTSIQQKQQALFACPTDGTLQQQVYILQQLYQVVQSKPISPDELRQIEAQVHLMWASMAPTAARSTAPIFYPPPATPHVPPQQHQHQNHSMPESIPNIDNLLAQFSSNTTAALSGSTVLTQASRIPFVKLTRDDLNRKYQGAEKHLYEDLSLQCNQCGFRYPKTAEGQDKMQSHLDWHFRQNKKGTDESAKAHSRDWFLNENDWLEMRDVDTTREQVPVFFETEHALQSKAHSAALESRQKEMEKCVPMDGAAHQCAICHEPFQSFWHEEEEEWMLKNAVVVNGEYYHATCDHQSLVSPVLHQKRDHALVEEDEDKDRKEEDTLEPPAKKERRK